MIFLIPLLIIVSIYIHIVMYMKTNPFSGTNRPQIFGQRRQKSELRLIRRILMLVVILFVLGFPYSAFFVLIQFRVIVTYTYIPRISYLFITFGQSTSMLMNIITTDPIRKSLISMLNRCVKEKH